MHIRRTKNKGYIAKHDLRDKNGNPPQDGQRGDAEYSLGNAKALLEHVQQHMGAPPQQGDDEQEQAPQPDAAPTPGQ
jgi:hypothetical protein